MKRTVSALAIFAAASFTPGAYAYQDAQTWEFHLFGGTTSLDSGSTRSLSTPADLNMNVLVGTAVFHREVTIDDDIFAGFRIGFAWNPLVETEITYDKNRAHAKYSHSLQEFEVIDGVPVPPDMPPETVEGGMSVTIVTYQIGLLYHPLGKIKTRWQPYAALGGGYMDGNFDPSRTTASNINNSKAAQILHLDLERDDQTWLVTYGVGLKYHVTDAFALRAEARGKSSDLFNTRRDDLELNFGISLFVPGVTY